MKIDSLLIKEAAGIDSKDIDCDNLGLIGYNNQPDTLSFIDNENFLEMAFDSKNISAFFVTSAIAKKFTGHSFKLIICDDPRYYYYKLYNFVSQKKYVKRQSEIDPSSSIHAKAVISEHNVVIGKNVKIDPNVTIMPDVVIGDNCHIMSGAVLGSPGFEYKKTSKGILSVFHDGKVILNNDIDVGANTCIDKGFSFRNTEIDTGTKIDNLVYIAHSVHIGKNCLLAAGAAVMGSVTINDNVWVGPNSVIAPRLNVGNNAFITLGSAVTKNVAENEMVSGVFAIPHKKFIDNLKKSID